MSSPHGRVETTDSFQTSSERHRDTGTGHEKLVASDHYPSCSGASWPGSEDEVESRDDGHNIMCTVLGVSSDKSMKVLISVKKCHLAYHLLLQALSLELPPEIDSEGKPFAWFRTFRRWILVFIVERNVKRQRLGQQF